MLFMLFYPPLLLWRAFLDVYIYWFSILVLSFKGTYMGPEALQSHLNDSCYTNVLCW